MRVPDGIDEIVARARGEGASATPSTPRFSNTRMADQPLIPLFDSGSSDEDIEAVAETLRSGWLTMGPRTAGVRGAPSPSSSACEHAVALSSCTAALHLAYAGRGRRPRRRGDRARHHLRGHGRGRALLRRHARLRRRDRAARPRDRPRRRRGRITRAHARGLRRPLRRLRRGRRARSRALRRARHRADRGRARTRPSATAGTTASSGSVRPGGLLQLLLQQGALVRRGRAARHRRRRAWPRRRAAGARTR